MTSLPVGQTYEYAACLLGNVARVHGAPDDVEDAAAVRVERSRIIRAGGHRIAFLLEESVLRHVVGEPAVMAGQLGHLLSVMALPSRSASFPQGANGLCAAVGVLEPTSAAP
ncbi:Scr1 family TA system antitoxin-like transcriptional regulator [Streptomyces sp. NPDC096198]|uniref:Scr1 family TA system antitoxin-like transcriptional regulator n=1 Tax=Streptomyces sp. NPDC096198 TaxID=3366080 RepID=UPI00381A0509